MSIILKEIDMPRWTKTPKERLFEKSTPAENGCIEWTGSANGKGYGMMVYKGHIRAAHRISWMEHFGDIPGNMLVCHRCDNPKCINPMHLFLGTNQDNMNDMKRKGRQYTPKGEDHARSKLTWDAVRDIRTSSDSAMMLAKRYGVSDMTIYYVKTGKGWKEPSP
jgi:hypothetical protein